MCFSTTKHLHSKKHLVNGVARWKCNICNIEILNMQYYKAKYLKSKKHRKLEHIVCSDSESELYHPSCPTCSESD